MNTKYIIYAHHSHTQDVTLSPLDGELDTRAMHSQDLANQLAVDYPQVNWCLHGGNCKVNYQVG